MAANLSLLRNSFGLIILLSSISMCFRWIVLNLVFVIFWVMRWQYKVSLFLMVLSQIVFLGLASSDCGFLLVFVHIFICVSSGTLI